MRIRGLFRRRQGVDDLDATHQADNDDHKRPDTNDISLFFQSGQGYASDGRNVHFGIEGFYREEIRTVVIEEWGSKGTTREECPIPPDVEETKEGILQYLRENRKDLRLFLH